MKNLIIRFYIAVTTISPIRETYPVATTTTAEDTAITIDLNIVYSLWNERALHSVRTKKVRVLIVSYKHKAGSQMEKKLQQLFSFFKHNL